MARAESRHACMGKGKGYNYVRAANNLILAGFVTT